MYVGQCMYVCMLAHVLKFVVCVYLCSIHVSMCVTHVVQACNSYFGSEYFLN